MRGLDPTRITKWKGMCTANIVGLVFPTEESMPFALRDKRTGEMVTLTPTNPLCFLTKDEIESGEYLPEHIERIEVEVKIVDK